MDYRTSTVYSFLMHIAYGRIGLLCPSSIYVRYHQVKARATRKYENTIIKNCKKTK